MVQLDDNTPEAGIRNKKIASVPHHKHGKPFLPAELQNCPHPFGIVRSHKEICRPSDPEGCVLLHKLLFFYLVRSRDPTQLLKYHFIHFHCGILLLPHGLSAVRRERPHAA